METNRIPFRIPKSENVGPISFGEVINLISHAALAPSYGNLQPWK